MRSEGQTRRLAGRGINQRVLLPASGFVAGYYIAAGAENWIIKWPQCWSVRVQAEMISIWTTETTRSSFVIGNNNLKACHSFPLSPINLAVGAAFLIKPAAASFAARLAPIRLPVNFRS